VRSGTAGWRWGDSADPVAVRLLYGQEREAVARARSGVTPRGWRERLEFEMLTATAQVLVTRSVVIDDAVRAADNAQLIILGAGLDARAWRMPELAGVDVFEVDRPASQQDKRERVDGLEPAARSVSYVPVEFGRDALGPALARAGHRDAVSTTGWRRSAAAPCVGIAGSPAGRIRSSTSGMSQPGRRSRCISYLPRAA
jgi:methyltransferase (TIGR00027 family)